jgi:hypothetical protein
MTALLDTVSFLNPMALLALLALPLIWWLLRATPPRPESVQFPPLRLLLELTSRQETPDRTPWWLLLLRLALAALAIIAVATPLVAPEGRNGAGRPPLLIVVDNGWAAAQHWEERRTKLQEIITGAQVFNRPVTLATTAAAAHPPVLTADSAQDAHTKADELEPLALPTDRDATLAALRAQPQASREIIWLSDGLDSGTAIRFAEGLLALPGTSGLTIAMPATKDLPIAVSAATLESGQVRITAVRSAMATAETASARLAAANGRGLADAALPFFANADHAEAVIDIPVELRNAISSARITGQDHAGAVYLFDDRLRRKAVALQSGESLETAQPLLSPLHYLSRAMEPYAEISTPVNGAELSARLQAGLSMLVLSDIGVVPRETNEMISAWVEKGGLLLRFAGPRLAHGGDDLLPVTLRSGDRSFGSALSWEQPQTLQSFPEKSPFAGLVPDPAITVSRQVLAEPDPSLPEKVWASLADGTPLVTAARRGKGQLVLVHTTASPDWSNLASSGLFVEMLRRLLDLAPGAGNPSAAAADAAASAFIPHRLLDGHGEFTTPGPDSRPLTVEAIDAAKASPATPPGRYLRGTLERTINVAPAAADLRPVSGLPSAATIISYAPVPRMALAPALFMIVLGLFLADMLAVLWLGGGLRRIRKPVAAGTVIASLFMPMCFMPVPDAHAASGDDIAMQATLQTHLGFVTTGDAEVDRVSEEGLKGLNLILSDRTSAELGEPMAIDIERDDLVFFPLLYWPVLSDARTPSEEALARISEYMKNGGTIFFDLRDDGTSPQSLGGGQSPASEALARILEKVDIPPLEEVPESHVLTRSFYLLKEFPGRYAGGKLWVEQMDAAAGTSGNGDGVSAIIIGSNDYAGAWAITESGDPLYTVFPGVDRQREMAFRTGVNIVMYALTGNYKADQVHIPALLERLGQ